MDSSFLNYLIKLMHGKIIDIVKENIPKAQAAIQAKVAALNQEMKNSNSTSFMFNVLNNTLFPLNLTMTEAPVFDW